MTIVISRKDGGVSIMNFSDPSIEQDETLRQIHLDKWNTIQEDHEKLDSHFILDHELPDEVFFNAYTVEKQKVVIDMERARGVWKDELRQQRKPLLEALDTDFIRAIETEDKALQASITAKKQALRDITDNPLIAAAQTPEELKAVILPATLSVEAEILGV